MAILHFACIAAWIFHVLSHPFAKIDEESELGNCSTSLLQSSVKVRKASEYYWVQRGGKPTSTGYTQYTAPSDFSKPPAWTWQNEDDEQVRHSPLIDDKMNLYVMTTLKLRKFSPDGKILWTWHVETGKMTCSPALYQGGVYLLSAGDTQGGLDGPPPEFVTAHHVDMETGQLLWKKNITASAAPDSHTLFVYNDTCIVPMKSDPGREGTNKFVALSAKNGSYLWDYTMDEVVWNAVLTTPGDGTLLFAGSCGGAFRISFGGELIWRSGTEPRPNTMCSTGGGSLGPNGVYYTEYNWKEDMRAHVTAYRVSDGAVLWQKTFPNYPGGQYPAVGPLGKDGPLVVAVAIGDNPGFPDPKVWKTKESAEAYFKDPEARKKMGVPNNRNAIVVMDASTGNEIWRWEAPKWDHFAAAGDEDENMIRRLSTHSPENPICLPDLQGIPLISGDGTIYSSSSQSGDLTAIRDANGNGIIEATEISVFSPHKCFLNSPSLAPGMLAAAPCWGPMYVFKE